MNEPKSTKAFLVEVNSDLTEGRGRRMPKCICALEVTAIRHAKGASYREHDGNVTEIEIFYNEQTGYWYGPIVLERPSADDVRKQDRLTAVRRVEKRAREVGLTDKEILVLKGYSDE